MAPVTCLLNKMFHLPHAEENFILQGCWYFWKKKLMKRSKISICNVIILKDCRLKIKRLEGRRIWHHVAIDKFCGYLRNKAFWLVKFQNIKVKTHHVSWFGRTLTQILILNLRKWRKKQSYWNIIIEKKDWYGV